MWIKTTCRLQLDYSFETPVIMMLRPRSGASQWVEEEVYRFSESTSVSQYTDPYGNLCQRFIIPPGGFVIQTSQVVDTANVMDEGWGQEFVPITELPEDVLQYLQPSRYCESDRFGQRAISIAGPNASGYQQVSNINTWIRENIVYAPGTSALPSSASEIVQSGRGVCKDLAHLGVAMARSISIPARYVYGYLEGLIPMDLHAWFEVYLGDRWYVFDPTQSTMDGARVAIAYGRDAADVAIYHQFGPPANYTEMEVSVTAINRD